MKINVERKNNAVHFEATNEDGIKVQMDGSPEIGGEGKGARPMQMLLMGLGGCSGIDVSMMLKKMKQDVTRFNMEIIGDREADKVPSLFQKIHLEFQFEGNNLEDKSLLRAVELSMTKYCSVALTLNKSAELVYSVKKNGEIILDEKSAN